MRRKKPGFIYHETTPLTIELCRPRYQDEGNAIALMQAFCTAFECDLGRDIPEWILQALYDAFQKYLRQTHQKDKPDLSLDKILKLTRGKGRATAMAAHERELRDLRLMIGLNLIRRYSQKQVSVEDAAMVVSRRYWNIAAPSPERLVDIWYDDQWESKFERFAGAAVFDDSEELDQLLRSGAFLKDKYPSIFKK
jgi:hypothetical protein